MMMNTAWERPCLPRKSPGTNGRQGILQPCNPL